MSFNSAPKLVPVNLIHLDGSPALTGHYMVDMVPTHDGQDSSEHFVGSGQQTIPLTGYRDLEPGDILGITSAPLLRVPSAPHDAQNHVTPEAESPLPSASPFLAIHATPETLNEPSAVLLRRLDDDQRESFLRLWNTVPSHIRWIDFALDAPGWDLSVIDAFSATLTEYADIFFSSKLDCGACSLRPFDIKAPPGTKPI